MAENGNRGPNDFRGRNVRKRREPPIIDASATEAPFDPTEPAVETAGMPEPAASTPTVGPEAGDVSARGDTAETPTPPAADPVEASAPAPDETAEPVLFGNAVREGSARPQAESDPVEAPAEAVDAAGPVPLADAAATRQASTTSGVGPSPVHPSATARPGGGAAVWLTTLSTLVLLGALAWVLYTGPQRDGYAEVAALHGRLSALEARPDPSGVQTAVASLEKRIGAADADRQALARTVAGLGARLDGATRQAESAKADADRAAKAAQADADRPAPAPALTGEAAAATVGALAALAAKVDGVDGRVSALSADETRTAKDLSDLPKPVAPDFGPIEARVASIESQTSGKVAALDARLTATDGKANGSDARLNGFDAKVNGVDGKVNGFDARMNGFEARTNGLEARLNDTAADLGKLRSAMADLPKVDLGPLQAAASGVAGQVASLDGRVNGIEGRLAASKDGTRTTEARAVGSADEARATPIVVVGQAVQRSIADGRPYAADLATLKALGAEPDALAKLQPLAAGGAPTAAVLKARWDAVAGDVLAAVKPAAAGSALDRFAAGARALVQVRQVGAVAGDDAGALVTQVDAALDAGDVGAALAAWNRLPQAGRDRSTDWAAAARARLDAGGAAQDLVARAIAALGGTRG